jgi:soluble P-type ATPase
MIQVDIPGFANLQINHLILDYNGTIAENGILLPGIAELFDQLQKLVTLHVVTADTFGRAAEQLSGLPCHVHLLPPGDQADAKLDFVRSLGLSQAACIGNGQNDQLMVKWAALGIAVLQAEGAAVETLHSADIVCRSAVDALQLFLYPQRLVATLRT